MTDKSAFLKLPEIVMDNVLHYCDYMEIASLRKTCRSLREFVDTTKPDGRVDKVMIDCDDYEGKFRLQTGEKTIDIAYTKAFDGCSIFDTDNWNYSMLLRGEDYMELLKNDFTVFLRHQKSVLQKMEINGKPADIEQVLNILKTPQILLTLSSVDAQSLRSLSISSIKRTVSIDEITETEHWRHLDTCSFTRFRISDIRRTSHLNNFKGKVTMVTAADLDYLKSAFLNSPNFSSFQIHYESIVSVSDIATTFGVQPFVGNEWDSSRGKWMWFFRIPLDKSRVLSLNVDSYKFIEFEHKETAKVPTGAVIIG